MRLIKLALPVYVELLTAVVAVGLIDTLWVSGLGSEAVAAATVATTTENLALGVILCVGTGTTVLIGRRDGRAPLTPVIRTARLLLGVFALAVAVPGVLLREPIARLFTDDPVTAELTAAYFAVAFAGIPVFYAQNLVDGIFKGLGDTRTPMRTALLCNALVIGLDPLLIYGLGLGVRGAALATVAARLVTLAVAVLLLSRRLPAEQEEETERASANRADAAAILRTGLPMSGDFLARALVGMALAGIVGRLGVAALAGYGIGLKIMMGGVMAFYALRQAAMIRTSRAGDGPSSRLDHAVPVLRYGLAAGLAASLVLNALAPAAVRPFTADPAVAAEAVWFLRCMPLYLVPFGGLIAVGGVLQAGGRGAGLLGATLAGFAVQLPMAFLLSSSMGATGVWLAMAAGAALSLGLVSSAWRGRRALGRASARGRAPRSTRTAAGPRSGR
ncbi:multidrug resistance protein, MATE family [Microbispora rosea subsp. aerata]|nr:MATE family efflux transporter [Microbispora rosea]GGO04771.1 multidrug resistance protein, MATE family [Microbispora rosea subsp. aerata]GIH56273.1 multidrug resistance protein, MATE family [Microbispora rosea subsp. aerata]GLJ82287.1 multidrug resistance protein, MATE family [Microbispora rosea subsp. aerata]